jgi:hypothetical protein
MACTASASLSPSLFARPITLEPDDAADLTIVGDFVRVA